MLAITSKWLCSGHGGAGRSPNSQPKSSACKDEDVDCVKNVNNTPMG